MTQEQKEKIRNILYNNKCIADYKEEDPFVGIYFSDLIDLLEDAAEFGYNLVIDKACEWLRVELDKEEERHYIHVHGFDKERRDIFLEEFRKAMKGG